MPTGAGFFVDVLAIEMSANICLCVQCACILMKLQTMAENQTKSTTEKSATELVWRMGEGELQKTHRIRKVGK